MTVASDQRNAVSAVADEGEIVKAAATALRQKRPLRSPRLKEAAEIRPDAQNRKEVGGHRLAADALARSAFGLELLGLDSACGKDFPNIAACLAELLKEHIR